MLKQLFSALRGSDTLDEAFKRFVEMLEHAEWMFEQANAVLRREIPAEENRAAIYARDKSINNLLRSIRGSVVRHLNINPGMDVAACMALMSVAKDAERIGDYCKNVFEVGRFYKEDFHVARYHEPLEEIREETEQLFQMVRKAFVDSDHNLARDAVDRTGVIRGKCDKIVEQLLSDDSDVKTHEAVAYSLLARHYKRVAAHLANVATAVRGKVEELDFAP